MKRNLSDMSPEELRAKRRFSLSKEKLDAMKVKSIEYKKSLTLEYQLGLFVGEYIVSNYLPTLSTDLCRSRHVIEVSPEDTATFEKLNDIWFSKATHEKAEEEWKALHTFEKSLERKYLPDPLVCNISMINITDEAKFKAGLRFTLFNCDMCSYSLADEDIIINDDFLFTTTIKFKLNRNETLTAS